MPDSAWHTGARTPVYVVYMLSFLHVGDVWATHHTMFDYIRRSDHLLLVLNLLLLLCVAVLPFTTAVLSGNRETGGSHFPAATRLPRPLLLVRALAMTEGVPCGSAHGGTTATWIQSREVQACR
ncbi:MAG TPA: TMEM175 family protein [Gemmatimonadales bacterium]|nr:TMEM175 family protein [Gemmatimonadales bacterium]